MNITRVMFVGNHRLADAVLSLKFDHNILNINETYIVSPIDINKIQSLFIKYGLDPDNFNYINDRTLEERYPSVRNWLVPGDFRGGWLYQQALKLAAIDYIDSDVILLQDADTFLTVPYNCMLDGMPNLFVLSHEDHPIYGSEYGYYKVLENLLGIRYLPENSFVSEFLPVPKQDWINFTSKLNKDFLQQIFDSIPPDQDNLLWFSEYELLGSWMSHTRPVQYTMQRRLEYYKSNDLNCSLSNYNSVCNKSVPNFLTVDFNQNYIPNFDEIYSIINQNL